MMNHDSIGRLIHAHLQEGARIKGLAVTGENGGELAGMAKIAIRVPSVKVQHIQETHIAIGHVICQAVEEQLFPTLNNI